MIGLVYGVLAALYGAMTLRPSVPDAWLRALGLVHLIITLGALVFRGDLPPAGLSSALLLVGSAPAVICIIWPRYGRALLGLLAVLSIASIGLTLGPQGRGVVQWVPWSIPHIVLSVGALGSLLVAAAGAAIRLRGHAVGLLATALLFASAPLLSERADSTYTFSDGAPAQAEVVIGDLQGDSGRVRRLWVRAPGRTWPRQAGSILLLLSLLSAVAAYHAGQTAPRRLLVVGALGAALPVANLLTHWVPSAHATEGELLALIRNTIALELSGSEVIREIRLPTGPLVGGLGATASTVLFPLLTLALAVLAAMKPSPESAKAAASALEQRAGQLGTALLAGAVLTGMVWANFSWGGATYPDPKLYAGIVSLALLGGWHIADHTMQPESTLPSWLMLSTLIVLFWSAIGPELGWVAPTLHHFGL